MKNKQLFFPSILTYINNIQNVQNKTQQTRFINNFAIYTENNFA